ncbi:hypothetical protein [Candidatus Magnetominusculus xianensis]|uniref:Uncharacterized protein n=1 Tax=Candidatus Magnetominusculus xianensis TaxID=1748249 RepID=A0ABR5SJU5_9BACT|nr:hypothetical protein [Candidatus Magnetominusculus xianensis]KWT95110.1 hypothetical protein ASN18_0038 [Candidatus Magnetominusculus xianensis]MBF0402757.1 hypothetical protein [Nitrospirota bacterium]
MDRVNLQERIAAAIGQYDNDTVDKSTIEQESPISPNSWKTTEDSR